MGVTSRAGIAKRRKASSSEKSSKARAKKAAASTRLAEAQKEIERLKKELARAKTRRATPKRKRSVKASKKPTTPRKAAKAKKKPAVKRARKKRVVKRRKAPRKLVEKRDAMLAFFGRMCDADSEYPCSYGAEVNRDGSVSGQLTFRSLEDKASDEALFILQDLSRVLFPRREGFWLSLTLWVYATTGADSPTIADALQERNQVRGVVPITTHWRKRRRRESYADVMTESFDIARTMGYGLERDGLVIRRISINLYWTESGERPEYV